VINATARLSDQLKLELAYPVDIQPRQPGFSSSSLFRPIHYLGSKLRLVDAIRGVLDSVDPSRGPACDLFAGSGTVSLALCQEREIVAVDIQEYSRVLCSALLNPRKPDAEVVSQLQRLALESTLNANLFWAIESLTEHEQTCVDQANHGQADPLCDLLEHGSLLAAQRKIPSTADRTLQRALKQSLERMEKVGLLDTRKSMVVRHFGGVYFSYRQAATLELILDAIHNFRDDHRDLLLAALLSTTSDVVNTVGKQFAQPIRPRSKTGLPKRHLITKIEQDRSLDVWEIYWNWLKRYQNLPTTAGIHRALRADYRDALRDLGPSISVVYADPPYTRDHYSRFYHVLETLCFRDDPEVSTVNLGGIRTVSRGVYRENRHQSPFCIKSQAPAAFNALFKAVREKSIPLVLSYSPFAEATRARPRVLSISQIQTMAKKYYKSVELAPAGRIAHNKLNTTELNTGITYDAEILLACTP